MIKFVNLSVMEELILRLKALVRWCIEKEVSESQAVIYLGKYNFLPQRQGLHLQGKVAALATA